MSACDGGVRTGRRYEPLLVQPALCRSGSKEIGGCYGDLDGNGSKRGKFPHFAVDVIGSKQNAAARALFQRVAGSWSAPSGRVEELDRARCYAGYLVSRRR